VTLIMREMLLISSETRIFEGIKANRKSNYSTSETHKLAPEILLNLS